MRMLLKAQMDVAATNRVIENGSFDSALHGVMERLRPEAAYFFTEDGQRTCLMVFDLKDPSGIPEAVEPFYQGAHAKVTLTPVLTMDELRAGIRRFSHANF